MINNLTDFKKYALRQLGEPVVEVNITDEQIQDAYEYTLQKFQDYHYNGTEKGYLGYQITAQDVINKYVPIPPDVTGVIKVFDLSFSTYSNSSIFSIEYQLRLNDLWDLSSTSLVYYTQAKSHLNLLNQILNGYPLFRYNRVQDRLFIDTAWGSKLKEGQYIMVEVYRAVNPDDFTKAFNEQWFKDYMVARCKLVWGSNLKKFNGVKLVGGVVIDGQLIYDEAKEEIRELEKQLDDKFSSPPMFIVG